MTQRVSLAGILCALACITIASGCASTRGKTFIHPDYNFAFIERVAIVPFENLTDDRGAGARVSRTYVAELLATMAFDVVEPGEVSRGLESTSLTRTGELTNEQIRILGSQLKCQAIFLGSVVESSTNRSGSSVVNVVGIDVRLVETETGAIIWSTSHTEKGRGFISGLFGTDGRSMSEVSRSCVRACINALLR